MIILYLASAYDESTLKYTSRTFLPNDFVRPECSFNGCLFDLELM